MTGPAIPPSGEELREAIEVALAEAIGSQLPPGYVWRPDKGADAVLALPAVRDALAAQATLRRYANDPPPTSQQLRELVVRNRELEATVARVEALAGNLCDLGDAVVFPAPRAANLIDAALAGGQW